MPRFVFRQRSGSTNRSVAELADDAAKLGGRVLSKTASMLYVEGSQEMFSTLTAMSPDFVSTPEVTRDLPKPPRVGLKKNT